MEAKKKLATLQRGWEKNDEKFSDGVEEVRGKYPWRE